MFREYKSESGSFQKSITETTQSFTSAAETSPTQAGHLFPQVLKTDFRHDRRKSVFACWWHRLQPIFAEFHFAATRRSGAFFLRPRRRFFANGEVGFTGIIANCPAKGNGIFSKIRQDRRGAASVKRCSKGLGCFPTSISNDPPKRKRR